MFDRVYRWRVSDGGIALKSAQHAILTDYQKSGWNDRTSFVDRGLTVGDDLTMDTRSAAPA
jgi:hypothetical protein